MPLVIAAPAVVLAALFALLFLLVYSQMRGVIKQYLTFNVGVGPFSIDLLGWVTDLADYTYAVLILVFDSWTAPIANFIIAPIAAIESVFSSVKYSLDQLAAKAVTFEESTIPNAVNLIIDLTGSQGIAFAEQLANEYNTVVYDAANLGNYVITSIEQFAEANGQALAELRSQLEAEIASAVTDTAAITVVATSAAQAVLGGVESTIADAVTGAIGTAESYAAGIYNTVEQDIANALTTAEGFATTAIGQVAGISATDIDGAITGALSGIYTDIDTAITDVIGIIGTGDADVLAGLRLIPTSIPLDLTGLAALTGAGTLTMLRYLKECGIPNCQNLSQFGQDLQAILGIAGDAAFLEFLLQLIHHPSDAAATLNGEFGGIITGAVTTGRELVGL